MTLEEIKTQWAKDHSYENYFEFLNLTRKCDTDHVFIMDGAVTQIPERFAQSQTQELKDKNEELVMTLETIASLITSQTSISTVKTSLLQILAKYNHLNQKL